MKDLIALLGRVGLAALFILSGWQKIGGYTDTQRYMEAAGVPGLLLPLVILVELGGGLAILAGVCTRWVAIAMVAFALATAALFHAHLSDQMQFINFWKNVAIAGGFLALAAGSPGGFSLDARLRHEA